MNIKNQNHLVGTKVRNKKELPTLLLKIRPKS